jgi:hypothetical protein
MVVGSLDVGYASLDGEEHDALHSAAREQYAGHGDDIAVLEGMAKNVLVAEEHLGRRKSSRHDCLAYTDS